MAGTCLTQLSLYLNSVDSVLFSREVDPAELLMDLGFGGASTDRLARIPLRFFQPSKVIPHFETDTATKVR